MNFFGLLWVISAISSFISPQDHPKTLEYFSRFIPSRSLSFISRVVVAPVFSTPQPLVRSTLIRSIGFSPSRSSALRSSLEPPRLRRRHTGWNQPSWNQFSASSSWRSQHLTLASTVETQPQTKAIPTNRAPSAKVFQSVKLQPMPSGSTGAWAGSNVSILNMAIAPELATVPEQLSKQNLANPVMQLVGSFFRWSGDVRTIFGMSTPLVTITETKNPCAFLEVPGWSYHQEPQIRELDIGQCTGLWRSDYSLPEPTETVFQIQVKEHVVAEVPTQAQAEGLARRLQNVLRSSDFDPYSLFPTVINGFPAGKAGDEVLFWIEPELATLLDRNPDLLAIAWINNLRTALDAPPLPVTDAQIQMHDLIPTNKTISGVASWYGPYFHGRLTATGEVFNQNDLTAAHPSLPFDTFLKVTNLITGNTVIVRINDRGPYFENRSLDLSREAARCLGSELTGVVPYEAVIMQRSELAKLDTRSPDRAISPDRTITRIKSPQIWAKGR